MLTTAVCADRQLDAGLLEFLNPCSSGDDPVGAERQQRRAKEAASRW